MFLALMVPASAFAALDVNLKYGAHGSAVTELQEFLADQGVYSGPITGNFYALTLAGVKSFQTKEGISPVSGFWGPLSRTAASAKLDLTDSNKDEQNQTGAVAAPVVTPASVSDSGTQAQIGALTSQVQTLAQVVQQQITTQNPAPTQNPVSDPVIAPTKIDPVQNSRWFSQTGKDYVGCQLDYVTSINGNIVDPRIYHPDLNNRIDTGKVACWMSLNLKNGVMATLTMDDGNVYQMDDNKTFWVTELNFDPTWVYAGTQKERSWKVDLSYNDPINGIITGSFVGKNNINDLKAPF